MTTYELKMKQSLKELEIKAEQQHEHIRTMQNAGMSALDEIEEWTATNRTISSYKKALYK